MLKNAQELTAVGTSAAERADRAFDFAASWLFSSPMVDLLALFGEVLPEPGISRMDDAESTLDWLHLNEELPGWVDAILQSGAQLAGNLTGDHVDILRRTLAIERRTADDFNFRGGRGGQYRERAQADSADFSESLRGEIVGCAQRLGLVDSESPRYTRYDMTLVLGGGYKSPQLRARLAAEIASRGTELGQFFFLGSPRFLIADPPEAPEVAYYAEGALDEFDLMGAGACREFGLSLDVPVFLCGCESANSICPQWLLSHPEDKTDVPAEYTHERTAGLKDAQGRVRGSVLSASTHRPPYRPDTTDTFALWTRIADPRVGQRALVVTTQVFVPFQTFDGVKRLYLDHGVEVDAVGFGADWGDRPLTAEYLLQETLSAIRSARRLLVNATDILRSA